MSGLALNYFLPYQVRWILDESPTAIVEKSRRIGFTYAEAYRSVERRVRLGTDHYFASRDKDSAREFLEDCKTFVRVMDVVAEDLGEQVIDKERDLTAFVLRFKGGAKIVALSSNPDVFRGKGGDITLDEFAFHREPRLVLKSANASAKVWGHQVRIISTHNGEGHLFNHLVRDVEQGKRDWSHHKVTLLDAVDQGLVEKIQGRAAPDLAAREAWVEEIHTGCVDEDEWQEEYLCQPSSEQASLLSYDLIRGCEVDNLRLYHPLLDADALPAGKTYYAGYDVGRKRDLSVLWVLERVGDVYWTRVLRELAGVDYTSQEGLLDGLLRNRAVKRLCVDATGIGAMLAERLSQRWGSRAEGVTFTAPVKSEMAMPLVRMFQDKLIRVPATAEVREDLHKVRKTVTAAGNVRLDADRDEAGHADRFWALALAGHAADTIKVPLPRPVARKPVGW